MERLTGKGTPQKRATTTSHTKFFSLPFLPRPRHSRELHTTTSHLRPPPAATANHPRRLLKDTELGIFGAERYFDEGGGQQQTKGGGRRQKKGHPSGLPTTPTSSSEASWSSQLLSGSAAGRSDVVACVAAKASLKKHRRGTASPANPPWPFGGTCPCTRHKAVDVEERYPVRRSSKHIDFHGIGSVSLNKGREATAAGEEETTEKVYVVAPTAAAGGHDRGGAPTGHGLAMVNLRLAAESWIHGQDPFLGFSDHPLRHERFQFGMPFSDGVKTVVTLPVRIPPCVDPPDDPSRFSLEVFQPAAEASQTPRGSAEFRLPTRSPFPGEVTGPPRRSSTFSVSHVARVSASLEDELASDSSSDLFEIESFSTQASPSRPAHLRGSSPVGAPAVSLRAAKTPAGPSSSRVSRQPRRAADGCEEARPEREQQQNHAEHVRDPANTAAGGL